MHQGVSDPLRSSPAAPQQAVLHTEHGSSRLGRAAPQTPWPQDRL